MFPQIERLIATLTMLSQIETLTAPIQMVP